MNLQRHVEGCRDNDVVRREAGGWQDGIFNVFPLSRIVPQNLTNPCRLGPAAIPVSHAQKIHILLARFFGVIAI